MMKLTTSRTVAGMAKTRDSVHGADGWEAGRSKRMEGIWPASSLALVMLIASSAMASDPPVLGETTRVSVHGGGAQGNDDSGYPNISADGRYVSFYSIASNLVDGDTNRWGDAFVHDRTTGATTRVSVASDGTEGNSSSGWAAISGDGRYLAFYSLASNLVAGDTNATFDIFVHDQTTSETTRVSVASDGTQGNAFSAEPAISADGRQVAFHSLASNLVAGDTFNTFDVFVHDRTTGETTLVSVASDGTQGNATSLRPAISADGRYVAFSSVASNLVHGDTNGAQDVFVHDRIAGATTRVSVASDGTEGNSASSSGGTISISADGRYVAFASSASNLVAGDTNATFDVFVHDRTTGETTRVSVASSGAEGNNGSFVPAISADGRHVVFGSQATNLVEGDTNGWGDIFIHDRATGETARVSVASNGTQASAYSGSSPPAISADGRHVAFDSRASNLVDGDTNLWDIFVHDRFPSQEPVLVSAVAAVPNPVAVQYMLELTATASGGVAIASAAWTLDDLAGAMEPADGSFDTSIEDIYGSLMAPYEAGVYDLCVGATDVAGTTSEDACISLVVYDPSAGFVTGGGWIWSPPGALAADSAAMGHANFGFVSRYRKGANVPDGSTQFTFQAGDLNFHSNSYEWLVVTGSNHARFKGAGTVNSANAETGDAYQFMLWAGDGDPDTFRIKIWYEDDGQEILVYDNGSNQPIGGGRIFIHTQ